MGEIQSWENDDHTTFYRVGNSVMLFKIRLGGRWRAMRCYTRRVDNLAQIYGDNYLPEELYVYTNNREGRWIDVVLEEWIDGVTLKERVEEAVEANDRPTLKLLAQRFDIVAQKLLGGPTAHGDLTAENIMVTPELQVQLIDFDGMYLPQFHGQCSPELGTAAYNPPSRTTLDFDPNIDDFSIALISSALHILSVKPEMYHKYRLYDGLLFSSELIDQQRCEALEEAIETFLALNMTRQYRVATLLRMNTLRIAPLASIFGTIGAQPPRDSLLELTMLHGYVGYATPHTNQIIIPNIYDDGLEFSEGVVMVRLATKWLAIEPTGDVVMTFEGCQRVKSFRNGIARVLRGETWEDVPRR